MHMHFPYYIFQPSRSDKLEDANLDQRWNENCDTGLRIDSVLSGNVCKALSSRGKRIPVLNVVTAQWEAPAILYA
jgi:hypothetical protein